MADSIKLNDHFLGSVTVGERGQVVIPAEAREICGIKPGDKLLVFVPPPRHVVTLVSIDQLQEFTAALQALSNSSVPEAAPDEPEE